MSYKLYTTTPSFRAWKILVAAAYNNLSITTVSNFRLGVDNTSADFLEKNPLGKVPVLDTPDGAIFESNAIARYVARTRIDTYLLGSSFYDSAQVDQWLDVCSNELEPVAAILLYQAQGILPTDAAQQAAARAELDKTLSTLDEYLALRTFLVGQNVTLADIAWTAALVGVFDKLLDASARQRFAHVTRWYFTCRHQPQFVKVIGVPVVPEDVYASSSSASSAAAVTSHSAARPAEERKTTTAAAAEKPKKTEANKENQKANNNNNNNNNANANASSKKDKSTAAVNAASGDHDDHDPVNEDGFVVVKPPKVHPLEALLPSKLNLEATKRSFSDKLAAKQTDQFFAELWNNFDEQGYCLYFVNYKFVDDNKVIFITNNLVDGYVERLEPLRKYLLGVLNVMGQDQSTGPFQISGCFMFRGPNLPTDLNKVSDSEYYQFTRVDLKDAAQRQQVEAAFTATKYLGVHVLNRKYIK